MYNIIKKNYLHKIGNSPKNDLFELVFDKNNEESIIKSLLYAKNHYFEIKKN